jgi:hypothetical protein
MGDMADSIGEWDDEWYEDNRPTCRYCGAPDLVWRRTYGRWTLWENDGLKLHVCPIKRKSTLENWHWPKGRKGERDCPHGVGHGGIHGCDGCCAHPSFEKRSKKMTTGFEPFWTLWQPESPKPTTRKLFDRDEAYEVAEAMTAQHKVQFYVMKSEALCELGEAPVKWFNVKKGK